MKIGITLLATLPLLIQACPWQPAEVAGAYNDRDGGHFFETFELSKEGQFNSWLHERPETQGSWQLGDDCVITVHTDSFPEPFRLRFTALSNEEATIITDNETTAGHYQRLPLAEE